MSEEKDVIEIDLWKLLKYYAKKWLVFLAAGGATALCALLITAFLITPMYKASVTVYVNNANSNQSMEYISGSNLDAAQKLVSTYVNIIKSNTVLGRVIEKGNLNCSADQLRRIMSAAQVDETELFTVTITDPDPEMAAHIANTIADVAPAMISDVLEGSSTKVIDRASVPQQPSSPSYPRNVVLGGLVGILLAGIVLTLQYLFDFRLRDEKDIEQYFDLPVLGSIPSYSHLDNHRGGYEERASVPAQNRQRRNG